jgi:hypothetical protein
MGLIGEWRAARERRRLAEAYLRRVLTPIGASEIDWLAGLTGDRVVAERELTFAKRAIGLIVAERDALDDRTAADVVHALAPRINDEARGSANLGRQWLERRRAYTQALVTRGQPQAPATRLARVLLVGAGVAEPTAEALAEATAVVQAERARANEALRAVFGEASLPEDVRPSALRH